MKSPSTKVAVEFSVPVCYTMKKEPSKLEFRYGVHMDRRMRGPRGSGGEKSMYQPLADFIRPTTLDDVVGQDHIY